MPIQSYNIYTLDQYRGQESDASTPRVNATGHANANIRYGIGVQFVSPTVEGALIGPGSDASGNLWGIAIREMNHEADNRPSDGTFSYKTTEAVSCMREGFINVENTGATTIVAGALLFVDAATGEFSADVGIATLNVRSTADIIPGGIGKVRIDIV